jgi:hypothetical protein
MMSHLENIEETVREISAKTINQEGESKEVI